MSYVLVIDDHDDCRELLAELLELSGYACETAASAPNALAKLRAADELPFLILTDLTMPDMDGAAFRAEQVADPRLRHIPVVVVSAHQGLHRIGRSLGVETIPKPIDVNRVLNAVTRARSSSCQVAQS